MRYWLKAKREEKHMTVQQVASQAGLAQAYLTNLENGKRGEKLPVDTAKRIANVLGFSWTDFYEGEGAMDGGDDGVVSGFP